MTPGQRQSVLRIDRDRRSAHAVCRRRLTNARRTGDVGGALRRPAMLAYLSGMRRTVLDASRALRKDVRVAHHELSLADDRKDDAEIRRCVAWLGLSADAVERMRADADRAAGRVAAEIGRLAGKTANVAEMSIAAVGGNVARFVGGSPEVFGRFGRDTVSDRDLDTWAETVAYSQYERGRDDAVRQYPAVSEALWGYRWSSILDNRTTTGCRKLDDWVAPIGDTWMDALRPPRHFNCRAVLVPVWQSSELRPPTPIAPKATAADLQRYLAEKEAFTRRVA